MEIWTNITEPNSHLLTLYSHDFPIYKQSKYFKVKVDINKATAAPLNPIIFTVMARQINSYILIYANLDLGH